jgi:hypothetical protein
VRASPRLIALAVALAALVAHAGSLAGGFVYDYHRFLEHNPAIRSLSDPGRFFTDPATASAEAGVEPDIYRPLRTLSFAVDHAVFGEAPFGYHLENVLLHAACAALVFLLLLALLAPGRAGTLGAAAGALVFAWHPVTSESVAWVSSRGDLLAVLFVLLALRVASRDGVGRTAAAAALVSLACLAKESAVVAFLLLPLYTSALPPQESRPRARVTAARTAILLAVTLAYVGVRAHVLPPAKDLPFLAQTDFPGGSRLATARAMLAAVVWYARVVLWPSGFPFDERLPVPATFADPVVVVGAGILVSVAATGILALARGRRILAFACLGTLAAMIPVSNVVVPLKALVAERFLYPALPCLAAGAALLVATAVRRVPGAVAVPVAALGALVLAALGGLSFARDVPWRSEESLWTAVHDADPMNARAYEGLAHVRRLEGKFGPAETAYTTFLEFQPNDGKSWAALGDLFGEEADVLSRHTAAAERVTDVRRKEQLARRAQIDHYRAALTTWERVGLARGRGSPSLLRQTLERWRDAAVLFPDLGDARIANESLALADVRETGSVSWEQRLGRVQLAWYALTFGAKASRPSDPDVERTVRATRAALLSDLGVDPAIADSEAKERVLRRLDELVAERPSRTDVARLADGLWRSIGKERPR